MRSVFLVCEDKYKSEAENFLDSYCDYSWERSSFLINLDCAAYTDGILCFTNAGALFFRVNDEDVKFRHAGIVCALYKGTDKSYIIDAKELNSDAVCNIDDALAFLKRHLNMSYKIETLRRENILELLEDALREAIVNAVCHRNYFEKGARVMVEIFDDRVEIISPGGVCKGITPENFGKISITRNSVIASMLYRIDYIEQMGTGILRMKNATKTANVAEPQFDLHNFFAVRPELHNMIEWYIGTQHGFNLSTGKGGKYFKHYLSRALYAQYADTYSGGNYDDIWAAVFTMCDLFHTLAAAVAAHSSFIYLNNRFAPAFFGLLGIDFFADFQIKLNQFFIDLLRSFVLPAVN